MPHAAAASRCPEHQITRKHVQVASRGRLLIVKTYFPGEGKVGRRCLDSAVLEMIRRYRIEDAVWPIVPEFILQDKLGHSNQGSIARAWSLIGTIMKDINSKPRISSPKIHSVRPSRVWSS